MITEFADAAVHSVLTGRQAFCKFLSANDTGKTGGHQAGILISRSALEMLFHRDIVHEHIEKRSVEIFWQQNITTQSRFTWYSSKNELRITCLGKGFPYLKPDQTGSLFVLTRQTDDHYSAFFLETEDEIERFLDAFGRAHV